MFAFASQWTCVAVGLTFSAKYLLAYKRALLLKLLKLSTQTTLAVTFLVKIVHQADKEWGVAYLSEGNHLVMKFVSAAPHRYRR